MPLHYSMWLIRRRHWWSQTPKQHWACVPSLPMLLPPSLFFFHRFSKPWKKDEILKRTTFIFANPVRLVWWMVSEVMWGLQATQSILSASPSQCAHVHKSHCRTRNVSWGKLTQNTSRYGFSTAWLMVGLSSTEQITHLTCWYSWWFNVNNNCSTARNKHLSTWWGGQVGNILYHKGSKVSVLTEPFFTP